MENQVKQSQKLLAELDALIEKDYQEALSLIALFKQETLELRENNLQLSLEFKDDYNNFEDETSHLQVNESN